MIVIVANDKIFLGLCATTRKIDNYSGNQLEYVCQLNENSVAVHLGLSEINSVEFEVLDFGWISQSEAWSVRI